MKQSFFIVGGESSSTRLHTQILVENGVFGDYGHEQQLDSFDEALIADKERVVMRRSIPHNNDFSDLDRIAGFLSANGRHLQVIVTVRSWRTMLPSQVNYGHTRDHQSALTRTREAYRHIFDFLHRSPTIPYYISSYDALLRDPEAHQLWLLGTLGVPFKQHVLIDDTDKKYEDSSIHR